MEGSADRTVVAQLKQPWMVEHRGIELDGRALHVAMKHGRLC